MAPDVRWVGTESGYGRETEWSVVPMALENLDSIAASSQQRPLDGAFVPGDLTGEDLGSREAIRNATALTWYPAETDVSIRPGWFYHSSEDALVKTPETLVDIYYSSVGRNGVLLLNIPPDTRGLIHANDIRNLRLMRKVLDGTFAVNLLKGSLVRASGEAKGRGAKFLLDADPETYWTTAAGAETASVEFTVAEARTFDAAMLQEHILGGQRVERFLLESWDGTAWKEFAKGTTIGYKRLLRFPAVTARRVRLVIGASRLEPALSAFGLYKRPPSLSFEPEGGAFVDSITVRLSSDAGGAVIRYTLDGSEPTARSLRYTGPITLTSSAVIAAKATTARGVGSLPRKASFNRAKYGIVLGTAFSPQYPAGGPLALIDGVSGGEDFKDGHWQGYEGVDIDAVVDLGISKKLTKVSTGFLENQGSWIFLPRHVEYSVSEDGKDFTAVTRIEGEAPAQREGAVRRSFSAGLSGVSARYVRMRARSLVTCPAWHPGAGRKAWLFADEITIE